MHIYCYCHVHVLTFVNTYIFIPIFISYKDYICDPNPSCTQIDNALEKDSDNSHSVCADFTNRVANGYSSMDNYKSSDDGKNSME